MKYKIDYPLAKMQDNLKRIIARQEFKYYDRVPVNFCIEPRYLCKFFGIPLSEYYKDAKTQFRYQIEFAKFQIENIPCDYIASPVIYVTPYFDNVKQASAFGCEVAWPYNETLQAIPYMTDIAQMENFKIPEPDAGLWGTTIKWWHEMKELCGDVTLVFADGEGKVAMAPINPGGLGPHMVAVDMAGTEFYCWMAEEPEMCHEFLEKITLAMFGAEDLARKTDGMFRGGFGLAEDSSTILSSKMFTDMVIPYTKKMYDRYGAGLKFGRGLHMCGPSTHLLDVLADDLKITSFDVFGYLVDPKTAAQKFRGKTLLWGNINPMLVKDGTKEQIKKACAEALAAMAPCGGFMLGDGANICPGTPLENLAAFTEAAQEYEVPAELKKDFGS